MTTPEDAYAERLNEATHDCKECGQSVAEMDDEFFMIDRLNADLYLSILKAMRQQSPTVEKLYKNIEQMYGLRARYALQGDG